ncbi:DNA mismatch repair endonuclease MutL [Clostridium sp. 19966]|uniref:DNA mismatch repair endonuclease MutL n=1 Tax=Clostridium sp. 19966 TaxID=2768166 RepID=UPI0028DE75E4|nr:DNA mismatch repair endonuclease MutL [Clostridium sp. 19966]MDT8716391.1 DNA mismatch repair endonuclease MutL [Clostridium sp. 19966]
MKRINMLTEETSNKIAAGEVIERPFSVVKELVENSIDAGSNSIDIIIEEGGLKSINIIDDGSGIHPEDLSKAFLPHSTSKIQNIDDIFNINTLGFRGEALASIAAVSKVNLKSRTKEFDYGRDIEIESGKINSIKDAGCNLGTNILVRDLFFNVPARLKFMKSSSKEASSISDIINRLALCNPDKSFNLINNNKNVMHTYGTNNIVDVIRIIYGKTVSENIIYFENHNDTASVYGYIGNADITRGTRNHQSIFVNKRYIKSKLITAAVENALKSFLMINKFPFFVVFLDIYPEYIDVNIHPTKAEIKFKEDREIFKLVFDGVHSGLRESLKEKFELQLKNDINELESNSPILKESLPDDSNYFKNNSVIPVEPITIDLPLDLKKNSDSLNSYTKIYDQITQNDYIKSNKSENISENQLVYKEESAKFPDLKYIGTFNNTYIMCEYASELYIIDQHAAHERIMFEKYRKEIGEGTVTSQILLSPVVLELSAEDYFIYSENDEIFKNAGFNIEVFGDNTITIREVPYILGKLEYKNMFLSMIDSIKNSSSAKTVDIKYNNIATLACKSAVKANHKLNEQEIGALLNDLRYAEEPFNCPHGRPTIIKMTLYELEKKFKRIQ